MNLFGPWQWGEYDVFYRGGEGARVTPLDSSVETSIPKEHPKNLQERVFLHLIYLFILEWKLMKTLVHI